MKKYFFLILICTSLNVFGQKNDTIFKTDGTKIIEDIKHFYLKGNYFQYSSTSGNIFKKASKIPANEVFKVVILENYRNSDKVFVSVHKPLKKGKNNLEFTEILVEGYCELYTESILNATNSGYNELNYLIRPGEIAATKIKSNLPLQNSRNRVLIKYFSDCPKIINYINSFKKIKRKDLIQIVKKYNAECSK